MKAQNSKILVFAWLRVALSSSLPTTSCQKHLCRIALRSIFVFGISARERTGSIQLKWAWTEITFQSTRWRQVPGAPSIRLQEARAELTPPSKKGLPLAVVLLTMQEIKTLFNGFSYARCMTTHKTEVQATWRSWCYCCPARHSATQDEEFRNGKKLPVILR